MSTEQAKHAITLRAAGDLSTKQYYAVDVDSNGRVAVQTSAGGRVTGILQNKPSAIDQAAEVAVSGIIKGIASAAINPGADVQVTTDGSFITSATTGHLIFGVHVGEVAAASGDIIPILVQRGVQT